MRQLLIHCGDGTNNRTTRDEMRALPKAIAPVCYAALTDVIDKPGRPGTVEIASAEEVSGGSGWDIGPLRRYSAVPDRVWLYFTFKYTQHIEERFYLVLVRDLAAEGEIPSAADDRLARARAELASVMRRAEVYREVDLRRLEELRKDELRSHKIDQRREVQDPRQKRWWRW